VQFQSRPLEKATVRAIILIVGAVFALAMLSRAMTYTVRFTEAAVLTTFGRAGEGAEKVQPGLKFKWPDPIQTVTKYDTRARFLQTQSQTQQTADSKQIVVESFATWRVKNPLAFFQRFSNAGDRSADHYKKAEDVLRGNLRSAMGEISGYRLSDLFTTDAKSSKLADLEKRILDNLKTGSQTQGSTDDYGIEVVTVGINRIVLPEETTKAVFESMKSERNKLIKELESRGVSRSTAIISAAEANAKRIELFTESLAAEIRKTGDEEATQYVQLMQKAPELAVFLKNVEFIRETLAKRITLVFSTNMPGMELFSPGAMTLERKNGVPGVSGLMNGAADPARQQAGSGESAPVKSGAPR
jgi:modulator of FtsH protease HflC